MLLALGLCAASKTLAQPPSYAQNCQLTPSTRALCETEAKLTDALRRNDIAVLSQLYADEFSIINFRGRKVDKAAVLNAFRTGMLRFDSLSTSDLAVRTYESIGVITGRQHQAAREPGAGDEAHPKDVRFTHIYARVEGKWLLVASQITPISP